MGKRQYDRQKHSAKAYDLKKSGKAGKGGWGDALDDYKNAEEHYEEEYAETEVQKEQAQAKEDNTAVETE